MKRKFGKAIIILFAAFVVLSSYAAKILLSDKASKLVSLFPQSETVRSEIIRK